MSRSRRIKLKSNHTINMMENAIVATLSRASTRVGVVREEGTTLKQRLPRATAEIDHLNAEIAVMPCAAA